MKLAIIGTVGLPAKYGGFETLTEYLTKHLGGKYAITVYCSSKVYAKKLKTYNGARLKYIPLQANGVQSILYDLVSLFSALRYVDTILILGVSGCIVLPLVKAISNKKIIVNIDGLEWKRAKWGKFAKWFLKYSEKLAVNYADTVISDNKVIQQYVRNVYSVDCELIAYGANHTNKEKFTDEVFKQYSFLKDRYAFKVCRIEPENNVHMILEAFSRYPDVNLVMVGNWQKSKYGQDLKGKYAIVKNIHLLNPIYDQHILNQIRSNCYLYIHGHSAGGTNPSLVEAMYLELPIFAYKVNYNKETTACSALYFKDEKELIDMLANTKEEDLSKVARKMKDIADEKYSWEVITNQYASLF
ncbi:glycosyltransferase involved in cell wall biosynthesis [Saonia flava]|uniref:Glycosyltransferase involved in cell wall biosynthesis n=1 Tax=Saonia flava TaxID=523696 RepID=A0A846R793_9FLAO|nr:DUF1972 domain-containing protein [Saonia flava]NJB72639.1 glycosyltransferase involved in cell wall biosynthesis [Saonia flava]